MGALTLEDMCGSKAPFVFLPCFLRPPAPVEVQLIFQEIRLKGNPFPQGIFSQNEYHPKT